jgi:DNA-binding GntR family transcriptional regulator
MFDTRRALEVMLTRRAAIRRSDTACAELASIQEELEQYVRNHDAPRVHDANRRFHNAIYVAAQNPDALLVVRRYWVMNAAIWRRYGYAPERFSAMVQDHRHLLRAIRERDVEAAAVLIGAHVIKAKQNLLTIMARDESYRQPRRNQGRFGPISNWFGRSTGKQRRRLAHVAHWESTATCIQRA